MAKNKKRNNLCTKRGNYYYRIMMWTGTRQKEITIPLKTKNKSVAFKRGKKVSDEAHNIKDGTIQRFQFKDYFAFKNDKGASILIDKSMQDTINDYLEYRKCMVKPKTYKRDKSALNQLRRFIGSSKVVEELSYKDIEGKNGLIHHLRSKGCSDVGINTSLRHIRTYVNWLFEKEKLQIDAGAPNYLNYFYLLIKSLRKRFHYMNLFCHLHFHQNYNKQLSH